MQKIFPSMHNGDEVENACTYLNLTVVRVSRMRMYNVHLIWIRWTMQLEGFMNSLLIIDLKATIRLNGVFHGFECIKCDLLFSKPHNYLIFSTSIRALPVTRNG